MSDLEYLADFYLDDLKTKFNKIKPENYYLSYSGGKDSHFLYWFIKEYAHIEGIEIVALNTFMEHTQILQRMRKNADVILTPTLKPFEIKEKYGSPCFSKWQDDMINRYQNGSRQPYLLNLVTGINQDTGERLTGRFTLNKTVKEGVLSGTLHKISPKCCTYLKKKPVKEYEKKTGKKAILGVRSAEGALRSTQYTSCFNKNGIFTPIHDLTDELMNIIYEKHQIELPSIYEHLNRTGCMGCPYGSHSGNTEKELKLITKPQFNFVTEYFKESYEVLGINVEKIKADRGDFY